MTARIVPPGPARPLPACRVGLIDRIRLLLHRPVATVCLGCNEPMGNVHDHLAWCDKHWPWECPHCHHDLIVYGHTFVDMHRRHLDVPSTLRSGLNA